MGTTQMSGFPSPGRALWLLWKRLIDAIVWRLDAITALAAHGHHDD